MEETVVLSKVEGNTSPLDVDRKIWNEDEYIKAIRNSAFKALVEVCYLITELKEKFFGDSESSKGWKKFCKDCLGMTHQQANKYVRICRQVIPNMSTEDVEEYGVSKLNLIASLNDDDRIIDVLDSVDPSMSEKEIKNVISDKMASELPADEIPPKPAPKKIIRMMEKLDFALAEHLPSDNDPDGKAEFKEFAQAVSNEAWDLFNRLREVVDASELFTMEHEGEKL